MKRKESIEENILNAAQSLFNTSGYTPVSLETIAEQAGVAKGTLYKYFGDKHRLIYEVLKKRDADFKASLNQVTAVFIEPKDKINAILSWHIRWFNSHDYHGCMFMRAQAEYGQKDVHIQSIIQSHKTWVEHLVFESLGSDNANHHTAHTIMLMLEGMINYTMLFPSKDHLFLAEKATIFQMIE